MAMRSSLSSFESGRTILGCGIDVEEVRRFEKVAIEGGFPFVFSLGELTHCRRLHSPAAGLCVAYCCKEALRKAIGRPYNFDECSFLFDETALSVRTQPTASFAEEVSGFHVDVEVLRNPVDDNEMIAMVVLGTRCVE